MNEITKENLKEEAIKAYYQSEQEKALKKIKDEQEFARQKAEALEELMAKFPGILVEHVGEKTVYDILGYKFEFSKLFTLFSTKKSDWGFEIIYFWGAPYSGGVRNLSDFGAVVSKHTKENWNEGYKKLKEAAK